MMFAVFENDNRECQQCHKPETEIDEPVLLADPGADPNVLTLHLKFCSMECAQQWADAYMRAREGTNQ